MEDFARWLRICEDLGMERAAHALAGALAAMRGPTVPKKARPRCGAKTRKGTPCQAPAVWDKTLNRPRNGRCRMHGGLSTGPKTPEGKARIAESNRRRAQKRREVQGE